MIAEKTTINWTYDNLNRLTREESVNNYTYDYTYDLANNRKSWSLDGDTLYYSYSARDQLLKESPNANFSNPDIEYLYDDNGSLTQKNEDGRATWVYGYNLLNQLESVTLDGTQTTNYTCNPDGVRVRKDDGTNPINYLIDSFNPTGYPQVFVETRNTNPETRITYIIGNDVLAQYEGRIDNLHMLLRDGHSSVRQFVDLATVSIENCDYDGYGYVVSGGLSTNIQYVGQRWDGDLGMYDNWRRLYDPWSGRFNQIDPYPGNIYDPLSLNKYTYCHANPINNIDPSGKYTVGDVMLSLYIRASIYAPLVVEYATVGALAAGTTYLLSGIAISVDEVYFGGTHSDSLYALQDTSGQLFFISVMTMDVGATALTASSSSVRSNPVKVVKVSASKYPQAAQHIRDAQKAGKPTILTVDRSSAVQRRSEALRNIPRVPSMDRDEYPPAVVGEGGIGASVRYIDPTDNRGAGNSIGNQLKGVPDGAKIKLEVEEP